MCIIFFFFFEPWLALALPISMKMKIFNLKKASFYCHDIPRRRQEKPSNGLKSDQKPALYLLTKPPPEWLKNLNLIPACPGWDSFPTHRPRAACPCPGARKRFKRKNQIISRVNKLSQLTNYYTCKHPYNE